MGVFNALGPAGDFGEFVDPSETEGCGGLFGSVSGIQVFIASGAIVNPDTSLDIVIIQVYSETSAIDTGTFQVNPADRSSVFFFFDNVSDFDVQGSIEELDLQAFLSSIVADYTFISTSGNITISQINSGTAIGTLDGSMINDSFSTIINVDGTFELSGGFLPTSNASMSELKTMFR